MARGLHYKWSYDVDVWRGNTNLENKMKKLTKLLTVLVVAFGGLGVAKVASADVSYNVGYVSEYYFRGILQ